jgi:hypothetical protein
MHPSGVEVNMKIEFQAGFHHGIFYMESAAYRHYPVDRLWIKQAGTDLFLACASAQSMR